MGKRPNLLLDRYRSQARIHASARPGNDSNGEGILPLFNNLTKTGSTHSLPQPGAHTVSNNGLPLGTPGVDGSNTDPIGGAIRNDSNSSEEKSSGNEDVFPSASAPATAPPDKSEDAVPGNPAIGSGDGQEPPPKPPILQRMKNGTRRFGRHFKNAIFHSWVNVLLVAVPVGIIVKAIGLNPAVIFAINAVAIIPLAGLLAYATESVAARLGDTLGALLNVSFGNAVELIIFIIALAKDELDIVQASILGSILANLLLILGMAFLLGGLRYREQVYNSTVTQMSACLLSLSVMSLLLPTAFHAAFNDSPAAQANANNNVLKVSRGTSVVLLIVYVLYLLFQLKSHAYMYESTPQAIIDEESHPGVLADIMNSSSSSSEDSDSDSSDSSASGSIIADTGKRVKRMFKHRKRRRSNATNSSAVTSPSILSAVSTAERNEFPWVHQVRHLPGSRRLSATTDGNEAELEHDDASPRIRDFVDQLPENEENKAPEPKKRSKFKHYKRHRKHKHRHHHTDETIDEDGPTKAETEKPTAGAPKVGFANEVQVVPSQTSESQQQNSGKFNVRQLSSRNVFHRPALPKMLSNNVFVQPPTTPTPIVRPFPIRSQSVGNPLQRSNSLPENLINRPLTPIQPVRVDPLPPFQHQRAQVRLVKPEGTAEATEELEEPEEQMSRTAAVVLLLCTTVLVAICAEFMVDAIPGMIASSPVSTAFIGLIILPIVGNAAEHVTAVAVAAKNKMDLAIGIALGSSIQIAIFVTPLIVLLGWIMGKEMTLYFNIFDTVCLFVTAFVVNFLILDGRSNYLEGSLLIAAYVIIALGAFFYPDHDSQSSIGTGGS